MTKGRLLLHICCAPDACVPWPLLIEEGWDTAGYFYGSNIHPRAEYDLRAKAVTSLAATASNLTFFAAYQPQEWFEQVRGLEKEPERGLRCLKCFEIQLEAAARYGAAGGFTHLCTTLTISPHKDAAAINAIGAKAAADHGLIWEERIWRKADGFKRSVAESKRLGLYRQNYCGCIFSLQSRDLIRGADNERNS